MVVAFFLISGCPRTGHDPSGGTWQEYTVGSRPVLGMVGNERGLAKDSYPSLGPMHDLNLSM